MRFQEYNYSKYDRHVCHNVIFLQARATAVPVASNITVDSLMPRRRIDARYDWIDGDS